MTQSADKATSAQPLWTPSQSQINASRLAHYQQWLERRYGLPRGEYADLWQWSVDNLESFWTSIWEYFDVQAGGSNQPVLASQTMPDAKWFPNATLNYAEHIFRNATDQRPALIARNETSEPYEVSWADMQRDAGALAAGLRKLGIGKGDRVVSYLPNRPETVVAFMACASLGAVWSSCAPDMGVRVVTDRFSQIEPKLIFATDSYSYNGKFHSRVEQVSELLDALPTVQHVIHVPGPNAEVNQPLPWRNQLSWASQVSEPAQLVYERVPFSHPLWVVYSSGTTGLPKAIVHSHGGIVLTHMKTMALQHDLREGDRLLFLGGTGWIVWNLQVGGLLVGATVVLYDGNPAWPDQKALWRFVNDYDVTLLGCGAAYLINCMKEGLSPKEVGPFNALRAINATGSPLPTDAFQWVYDNVKSDLWLASISGGTDIASGFVACAPTLPVYSGEIQCRELGVAAYAFNESGEAVVDEVGELVITRPMPSMPIYFWNDPGNERYHDSYFDMFPGYWRHGDWIQFTSRGTSIIYGRSDSTINRFGIRMGTAEIYRVVEALPEVRDSLVVDLEYLGRDSFMPLFVVLDDGQVLDDDLKAQIKTQIRTKASPRHVPNEIYQVQAIPRTLTGKKMEVPVRRLLLGSPAQKVAHPDAMANPDSLDFFIRLAQKLNPS
ncbi:acetoacetate--CoA ligase [Pusillimonas sp. DMV24BSW_D]|uniref:acetoacetate--CoA ligase n=1 Tax=Neopusillimonas aestuarii TaxID=2716226 RepID=UPI001408CA89|nr:acetoacetate--CoA ligase [Pusillimonas sp. DMV24BSW_D]QIM47810.1 acetoacetate--CoA ligase [Pusillimonas sp. DMV24BSW_D]